MQLELGSAGLPDQAPTLFHWLHTILISIHSTYPESPPEFIRVIVAHLAPRATLCLESSSTAGTQRKGLAEQLYPLSRRTIVNHLINRCTHYTLTRILIALKRSGRATGRQAVGEYLLIIARGCCALIHLTILSTLTARRDISMRGTI